MAAHDTNAPAGGRSFHTTQWSVVRAAGDSRSPQSAAALETLCRAYWRPLHEHVQRWGYTAEDARDLTQAFFAQLLAHKSIAGAHREEGRFRSFLLGALKNFLCKERERAACQKRGGGQADVSLDEDQTGSGEAREIEDTATPPPDRLFDRGFAETMAEIARQRLHAEYHAAGRGAQFDLLQEQLLHRREPAPAPELAARAGLASAGAARTCIHRLRERFQELCHAVLAETLADPGQAAEEMRHLREALRS